MTADRHAEHPDHSDHGDRAHGDGGHGAHGPDHEGDVGEHGGGGGDHGDHGSHHAHMVEEFKRRFWVSLALTIPILLLSPLIQEALGLVDALAIPLAAGALYWAGILLSPAVGAVLMSLSTVVVAVNARLLGRWSPESGDGRKSEAGPAVEAVPA